MTTSAVATTPLIFNDYYFIEALLKLNGREVHLW